MKTQSTLSNRLRNFFDDKKELREYLPYVIAKRISYELPFPSEETIDYKHYYMTNCEPLVSGIISDINEKFIFNVNEAKKVTYVIWNTRYQVAFNPTSVDTVHLLKLSSSSLIAPETIRRLHKHEDEIGLKNLAMLENIISEETL